MTTTFANNFPTKNKTEKFTEKMAKKTKLSETEIDRLVQIFKRITVFCANYVSVKSTKFTFKRIPVILLTK